MSELIRRDDAIESFSEICVTDDLLGMGVKKGLVIAEMRIKDVSAVDAVEVVRCRECRFHEDCVIESALRAKGKEPYCSAGRKK